MNHRIACFGVRSTKNKPQCFSAPSGSFSSPFQGSSKASNTKVGTFVTFRNDAITPWDELSAGQKRIESRKMELYAAMVDNLDDHVGRLLAYLKRHGLYDNTLVVFMADNGASGEDFYEGIPSPA